MKDHPKTTIIMAACILVWAIKSPIVTQIGEQLLGATIRVGFELFDGEDLLVGIG